MSPLLRLVATLTLVLGACATGSERADLAGALALELQIADGVLIESVGWAITGGDMQPMSGVIDTSASGSRASVEVFGIPPGDGYTVTLEATSTDRETTCAGSAPFDVEASEVIAVHVMLRCKQAPRFGGVRVNGEHNVCAELVKVVVSPLETSVGSAIDLSSQAEDAEGDPITTMWSASAGMIANPGAPTTTYACTEPGTDQIRAVVSDDGFEHCMSEWTVDVRCVSVDTDCRPTPCPDLGPCVINSCNEENGVCEATNLPDGTDCSAALPPLASCSGGVCSANGCISDQSCDDTNPCTDDFCNIAVGICNNVAGREGERCFLPGVLFAVCMAGECTEAACTSDDQCEPETQCAAQGVCELATGVCQAPVQLDDGTPCVRSNGTRGACINGFCGCGDDSMCPAGDLQCRSAGFCNLEIGLCRKGFPINEGGPCDWLYRGPESGRCDDGGCRTVCSVKPCPDRGLDCVFDTCNPIDGSCMQMPRPSGTSCTAEGFQGQCDGQGSCSVESCLEPTKAINVMCANSLTADQSPLPFTLSVLDFNGGAPLLGGSEFTADFTGVAVFPQFFLNGAQELAPGGVRVAELVDLVATVQVRSGATGPDVPLGLDLASLTPGPTRLCNFPTDQECTADTECLGGICNDPIILVDLPISDDCEPGGLCESLFHTGVGSQCHLNGFCITGDLQLQLDTVTESFDADPGAGDVLFGWADRDVPGLVTCPAPPPNCQSIEMPDGCYDIPSAVFDSTAAPLGIRVRAAGLSVPIQCAMAARGGICASGEGCIDTTDCAAGPCTFTNNVACPTRDAALIVCRRFETPLSP